MSDDTDNLGENIDCLRQGKPELLDFDTAREIATHIDLLDNELFDLHQAKQAADARIAALEAALMPFAENPGSHMQSYPCHAGILTDPRECSRCGNAIRAWEVLNQL